jgi:hypothetical protein
MTKGFTQKGHRGHICPICRHSKFWDPINEMWQCLNSDCPTSDKSN